jgi:hypothetical protein
MTDCICATGYGMNLSCPVHGLASPGPTGTAGEPSEAQIEAGARALWEQQRIGTRRAAWEQIDELTKASSREDAAIVLRAAAAGAAPAGGPTIHLPAGGAQPGIPAPASPAVREAADPVRLIADCMKPWLSDLWLVAHRRDLPASVQRQIERDVDQLRSVLDAAALAAEGEPAGPTE